VNLKTVAKRWTAAAWLLLAAQSGIAGTMVGSAHDFSAVAWADGKLCVACHTPHNAVGSAAPLWNHTSTTQTYSLYSSPSLVATMAQPTSNDKLCLSCHDGTVAVDSYSNRSGAVYVSNANKIGTDLNVHHPSSFLYDAALATANGALFDPSAKTVTVGAGVQSKTGTISALMLTGGQVQCSSCHDVHNTFTAQTKFLLKISKVRSAMCFACHSY
jgi:predicted CXXCH cytochrome family protein